MAPTRRHGRLTVGMLWVTDLFLIWIGSRRDAAVTGGPATAFDSAYLIVQLVPANYGPMEGSVSWKLHAGGFLIRFLTIWTATQTLVGLFRNHWRHRLLRF